MRHQNRTLAAAVAMTLGSAMAGSAGATVLIATYAGVFVNATNLGFFPNLPSTLDGAAFTATFEYDTSLGTRTTTSQSDDVSGNLSLGTTPPVLDAYLTVGGIDYSVGPVTDADVGVSSKLDLTAAFAQSDVNSFISVIVHPAGGAPSSVATPFGGSGVCTSEDCFNFNLTSGGNVAFGDLETETVSIVQSAAPEPATWAMMLLGFSGMGAALRMGRRGASAVVTG